MSIYRGNCATVIDWARVISDCRSSQGKQLTAERDIWIRTRGSGEVFDTEYDKIHKSWLDANYNVDSVKWINYYGGEDYDDTVNQLFSEWVGMTMCRAWVSRMDPGWTAAYHWDVDDDEEEFLKLGDLYRFSVQIGENVPGQCFIVEEEVFHNKPSGEVYQWDNYRQYHAAANCGLKPWFLYNFIGARKH